MAVASSASGWATPWLAPMGTSHARRSTAYSQVIRWADAAMPTSAAAVSVSQSSIAASNASTAASPVARPTPASPSETSASGAPARLSTA